MWERSRRWNLEFHNLRKVMAAWITQTKRRWCTEWFLEIRLHKGRARRDANTWTQSKQWPTYRWSPLHNPGCSRKAQRSQDRQVSRYGRDPHEGTKIMCRQAVCSTPPDTKSAREGKLPEDGKRARVSPIFKKGSRKKQRTTGQSVSPRYHVNKILESFIKDNILCYLEEHDLLSSRQHGFMKGR